MPAISRRNLLIAGAAGLTAPVVLSARAEASTTARRPSGPRPLARAHAHNDYEHDRPLLDALSHGFTSVEADVWLVDGELYLGHDGPNMSMTLRRDYLDPLRAIVRRNGHAVYPGWHRGFRLLIDVKSDGPAAYPVLQQQLAAYPELITSWKQGHRRQRPVTAVLSGTLANIVKPTRETRWFGFDGRIANLPVGSTAEQIPLVSDNWVNHFSWFGVGPMPADQRAKLHSQVAGLHADGYEVRYWNTLDSAGPAREAVWRELLAAKVDVLNTDDLAGLQAFLLANDS
ncbi:hypothetical protein [Luteipulveratus mongoliensis]|uniref:Altered inheritance of mitochondria protein 6 n=1 Tax=Luteipulveratus mongoliensis TaxID=571913 RepID=A0A0K1JIT2_9MICO|nr:hypothetical protein [Luteipulveratus mongoliensis]AKU16634.1 hypothetical protein VV02_13440 [Luteipulveratus mongoliensis]